jgi:hypothetical protein
MANLRKLGRWSLNEGELDDTDDRPILGRILPIQLNNLQATQRPRSDACSTCGIASRAGSSP